MSVGTDRDWADAHMDQVKDIIGRVLLWQAPIKRDRFEATDLIVLRAHDVTVGVRLRRPGYAAKWPNQFTVRAKRDSGMETELSKIVSGWGNYLFYGHVSAEGAIQPWMVIDLRALRAAFIRRPAILHTPDNRVSGFRSNPDGTHFYWFDRSLLPAACTLAHEDGQQLASAGPTSLVSA